MSLIYLEDNFITREQSRYIINYYKTHLDSVKQYDFNYPLSILNTTDYSLKTISDRILSICKRFKNDVGLDNLEIVKWPVKSHMKFHKDTGDVFASILYLNDNYIGSLKYCVNSSVVSKMRNSPFDVEITVFPSSTFIVFPDFVFCTSNFPVNTEKMQSETP